MEICVDFDGTCVTHDYPSVGKDIGAISVLRELCHAGHNLILFTMRSGEQESDAVNWFLDNDIPIYGINANPTQHRWTKSPKAYGQLYIDDAALGCPLIYPEGNTERPYADWNKIRALLAEQKYL